MRVWIGLILVLIGAGSVQAQRMRDVATDVRFSGKVIVVNAHPRFDNVARMVMFHKNYTWHTIPYPDDLTAVYDVWTQPDGRYLVSPEPDHAWILDPQAETLTLFRSKCPPRAWNLGENYRPPLAAYDTWITVQNNDEVSFCHPTTGEYTPVFRTGLTWRNPELSPDGRYLLIQAYQDMRGEFFYSYDRKTHMKRRLGQIHAMNLSSAWLTPTTFAMSTRDMPEWSSTDIYIGDVTQENSYGHAISRMRYAPRLIMEPLSFENMLEDDGERPDPGPCQLVIYDVTSMTSRKINTGDLCEEGFLINDGSGDRLYWAASSEILGTSTDGGLIYRPASIVRYNFETGVRQLLYRGGIDGIDSVSPDGTYAIVWLTDDGFVHQAQDTEGNAIYLSFGPVTPYIMRLSDGAVIAPIPQTEYADMINGEYFPPSFYLRWLTDNILINPHSSTLYTLTDSMLTPMHLPGRVLLAALPEPPTSQYDINYKLLDQSSFRGFVVFRTDDGAVWFYGPHDKHSRLLMQVSHTLDMRVEQLETNVLRISLFKLGSRASRDWQSYGVMPEWSFDVRLR